jgi:predicted RNase H-like nuclease (RuvC/YqgF family)
VKIDHNEDYTLGIRGLRQLNQERYKKRFREQYSQYTNKAIQKMDKNTLDFYMFSATKMGWINCDRFWDIDDQEKTHFVVNTTAISDTKVQIVFKDIKSIMNPTHEKENAIFENLPLGKQIKIIGISFENGKPTMAVAETTVDKDGFDLKDFKEFSLDDLETELNH